MAARVYVSHTPDVGPAFVRAAFDAIARAELVAVDRRLRDCDVYVLVVGFRCGPVERRFDEATAARIPRLVFLLDGAVEEPPFRQRLRDAGLLLLRTVTSPTALELEVFHALRDTVDSAGRIRRASCHRMCRRYAELDVSAAAEVLAELAAS